MVFPILGANTESAAYEISNSLRFNDDSSEYLSKTPSSASNRRTFTISLWVKRSNLNTSAVLYGAGSAVTDMFQLLMQNNADENRIIVQNRVSGTNNLHLVTTNGFRDPSAWFHIVLAVDTTQGTASNRAKLYVNGNQITAFGLNSSSVTPQTTTPTSLTQISSNSWEAEFNWSATLNAGNTSAGATYNVQLSVDLNGIT